MLIAIIMFVLLLMGSEARTEEYHVIGSVCMPVAKPAKESACAIWYAPVGYWPARSFHEDIPWENRLKADRLIPARPVTAEAAPK